MREIPLPPPPPEVPALSIGFADTSAEQLRFSLDHPRIAPLASKRLDIAEAVDTVLELHVIGSSHQVALSVDGTDAFIETFACLGEGAGPRRQRAGPQRPAWGRTRTTSGGWAGFVRHEFRCDLQQVPGDFGMAVAEVLDRARAADHHVMVAFPGNPHAVTALAATQEEPGHVSWQTWHCYPQHRQIVHSASRLGAARSADIETDGERS